MGGVRGVQGAGALPVEPASPRDHPESPPAVGRDAEAAARAIGVERHLPRPRAAKGDVLDVRIASLLRARKGAPAPLRYTLGPKDVDLRGAGVSFSEALDTAFRRTGRDRSEFEVSMWAKDVYGKSRPVEWRTHDGAEVSVDYPHTKWGPDAPHVGWTTGGKRGRPETASGHILIDDVPAGRAPP